MLRLTRSVWIIAVLFVAGVAWSVSAADKDAAPAAKPAIPKLKQKTADEPAAEKTEKASEEAADPFAVPDGTPKELVEYITNLISTRSGDIDAKKSDPDFVKKMRKAILKAADKILAAKPDEQEMSFAVEAKMNMLDNPEQLADFAAELKKNGHEKSARQVRGFMLQVELGRITTGDQKQVAKSIEEVVKFLEESPPQPSDLRLAFMAGRLSEMAEDNELAIKTYASLAKAFAASKDDSMIEFTKLLEGVGRRLNLVGQELKLEGKVLGDGDFDWSKYLGKVVLVDFWSTGYPASVHTIPNLKACYELFHDKGFEIVGVSLDRDMAALETFVKAKAIPWTILTGNGKPSPSVVYYGVVSLPTTILVGKDGKVVSLNASGESLMEEIEKLLGSTDAKPSEEGAATKEEKPSTEEKPVTEEKGDK